MNGRCALVSLVPKAARVLGFVAYSQFLLWIAFFILLNFHTVMVAVAIILNKLGTLSHGIYDPHDLTSTLAAVGTLQPRALGSLNRVDPLDSVSIILERGASEYITLL